MWISLHPQIGMCKLRGGASSIQKYLCISRKVRLGSGHCVPCYQSVELSGDWPGSLARVLWREKSLASQDAFMTAGCMGGLGSWNFGMATLSRAVLLGKAISTRNELVCDQTQMQRVFTNGSISFNQSAEPKIPCHLRCLSRRASERGSNGELAIEHGAKTQKVSRKSKETRSVTTKLSSAETASEATDEIELPSYNGGSIHLILGPMFAGKSTALLRRVQEESRADRRVALVKSDKDTRYGLSAIVTHDGLQMPCYAVPDLATFRSKVGEQFFKELDVIGIDEAQFFPDLYDFCQHAADFEGKIIIVAGLDGDFLRRRFGSTLDLIPVADSVVKLPSRCEICGRPAIFSFRKTLDIKTELVGGADVYMPVCRQHFVNGQIAIETTSTMMDIREMAQVNNE